MSFTAEVRDELARCEPECEYCDLSTLAALTRVSGTLSLAGSGRYRLTVATETGAVARTMITLTHRILKLKTEFTVRKSVLHKVRNYLITLPDQPDLDKALVLLGILDRRGGLVAGVPRHIVARPCCRLAYIRGALIAGGFVAGDHGRMDPRLRPLVPVHNVEIRAADGGAVNFDQNVVIADLRNRQIRAVYELSGSGLLFDKAAHCSFHCACLLRITSGSCAAAR